MLVSDDSEVLILVIEQGISLADFNGRVRVRVSAQLLQELVDMVVVDVAVTTGPDEFARFKTSLLGHHHGQQRVGSDIERHAKEHIAGTLVQLAGELAIGHVELEQRMAGRQRHLLHLGRFHAETTIRRESG